MAWSRHPSRGGALLPVLLCLLLVPAAYAGTFQILPMLIEVPSGSSIATYTLRNTSNRTVNIQVSAWYWTQSANEDHYAPAKDLLVVPQIVSIPPGSEQLVRVALRHERPARELNYRLHFDEIPPAPRNGVTGVQTVLDLDLPLFFLPQNVSNNFQVRIDRNVSKKAVVATIRNTGTRFLRISSLSLLNAAGKKTGERKGLMYVLPGITRHWTIHPEPGVSEFEPGKYQLKIVSDGKTHTRVLTLR